MALLAFVHGWRMWLLTIIGFALAAGLVFFWLFYRWIDDPSDLEHLDARVRGMTMPATWNDAGLTAASAERMGLWNDIAKSVAGLPARTDDYGHPTVVTGLPLPGALLAHHHQLNPQGMQHLLACLDALGPDRLVFRGEFHDHTPLPEIETYRAVVALLGQRVLIAPIDHLGDECRRMLDFIRSYQASTTITELVQISLLNMALNRMTWRLPDLKAIPERGPLSADILTDAAQVLAGEVQAWHGEYLMHRDYLAHLRDADLASAGQLRAGHPPWYSHLWEMSVLRNARAGALDNFLNYIQFLDGKPAASGLMAENRHIESFIASCRRMDPVPPVMMLYGSFMAGCSDIGRMTRSTVLHARLLAAEMTGAPWPIDDFSSNQGPLQKVIDGGRLIGAFSAALEPSGEPSRTQPLAWDLYGSVKPWQKEHRLAPHESGQAAPPMPP
jgi:hypothetical protein